MNVVEIPVIEHQEVIKQSPKMKVQFVEKHDRRRSK